MKQMQLEEMVKLSAYMKMNLVLFVAHVATVVLLVMTENATSVCKNAVTTAQLDRQNKIVKM